jgi:hypothetical protein
MGTNNKDGLTPNQLRDLKYAAYRLIAVIKDDETGLATWHIALSSTVNELHDRLHDCGLVKEKNDDTNK